MCESTTTTYRPSTRHCSGIDHNPHKERHAIIEKEPVSIRAVPSGHQGLGEGDGCSTQLPWASFTGSISNPSRLSHRTICRHQGIGIGICGNPAHRFNTLKRRVRAVGRNEGLQRASSITWVDYKDEYVRALAQGEGRDPL